MARFAVWLSLCWLMPMVAPSFGQVDQAVGATDFSTSNIHLSIPIRHKANFDFSLEINSHVHLCR
jgi:hypothetical protein